MTKITKTKSGKSGAGNKKLQLNKETLRDLHLPKAADGPQGGRARGTTHEDTCTMNRTQCDANRCD